MRYKDTKDYVEEGTDREAAEVHVLCGEAPSSARVHQHLVKLN
jgi:hypothetical protein